MGHRKESNFVNNNKVASTTTRTIPPRSYKPFSTAYLETPLWSLIVKLTCIDSIDTIAGSLYRLRDFLASPMRTTVIPRILARVVPNDISNITFGDLVLLVPLLVFSLRGIHYTFVVPSVAASGTMASYAMYYTFVTASKANSPFSFLLGIPYERLIGLHWLSGLTAVGLGLCHGYVSYQLGKGGNRRWLEDNNDGETSTEVKLGQFIWDGQINWSGTVLLIAAAATVLLSSLPILRRFMFNVWYFTHIILGITVVVMLFLHSVSSTAFVAIWWSFDLFIRYAILAIQNKTKARIRIIGMRKWKDMQPHEPAVEVIISKPPGFTYKAGQFVRIAIPAINAMEFHPFSISSAPHEECVTLHIRRLGDWTDKLVQLAEKRKFTTILLEGPYGASSIGLDDDEKYKLVLCVSGGIGVTPCQSIGKDLLHSHRTEGRNLKQLRFVWTVRDLAIVDDIPPLLLEQEPDDDYSTSSPEYRRMVRRSDTFRESIRLGDGSSPMSVSSSFFAQSGEETELPAEERNRPGTLRRPAVVQVDVYCTRSSGDDVKTVDESGRRVPYNVYQSRPNLDKIFEDFKQAAIALGERNVAVIGCGPSSLMSALQDACLKHSASVVSCGDDYVFFDLHKEHFAL